MRVVVLLLVLATARRADADERRWYGWQNLAPDVVGLGAMTAGGISIAETNSGVGALFFYGGFVVANFGGPFIHLAHRQELQSVGSYAMRTFAPALGLLGGYALGRTDTCDRDAATNPCIKRMIYGTIAGAIIAAAIDDAFIAWEPVPSKRVEASWYVTVAPVEHGGALVLGGSL